MPIIKSAKKALKQSRKRKLNNESKKIILRKQIGEFKKKKEAKSLPSIFRLLDKMVKTKIIHKNKASRIKSRLSKKANIKKTPSKK